MAKIKAMVKIKCSKDVEQVELSEISIPNVKWYNRIEKQFGSFL